jgi:hypothetical protein
MPMVNRSRVLSRLVVASLAALILSGRTAVAQPGNYIDLGVRTSGGVFSVPVWLAHPTAVQWYRIELPATGPPDESGGFIDISAMPSFTQPQFMRACGFALFDSAGTRVAASRQVSDFSTIQQLSLGSSDPRPPIPAPPSPWDPPEIPNPPFSGQDGSLVAGIYWVSVANHATCGPGPWDVGSTANPVNNELETVLYFNIQPAGEPYCDPDFNWDGNVDQEDAWYLINVIAGGQNETGRWADYNRDGNEDQDDVLALIHTIAGGGCP